MFRKELLPTYKPCCDTPQLRLSLRIPVKSKKCATIVRYQMSAHNEQSLVLRQGKQVWAVEQDLGPAIFIVHKSLSGAFDACESQNDVRTDELAYRVFGHGCRKQKANSTCVPANHGSCGGGAILVMDTFIGIHCQHR